MDETALDLATQLIIQFEGFKATPYLDSAGVWTIGYGTTHIKGIPVSSDTPRVTPTQANALMSGELSSIYEEVVELCPPKATVYQIAACTSFAYNEGLGAFRGSTLLRLWEDGEVKEASDEFMRWVYDHDPKTHKLVEVEGLKNRRKIEQEMFLTEAKKEPVG